MTTYIDSSALVPVYVPERFSEAARSAIRAAGNVPFTALHRLEVQNAFEMLVGRKSMTKDECRSVQAQVSLCSRFVSADDRQLELAKASGLTPVDIKRRIRRQKR